MALDPSNSSNLEQLSLKGLNVVAVKDILSFFGLYDDGYTMSFDCSFTYRSHPIAAVGLYVLHYQRLAVHQTVRPPTLNLDVASGL